MSDRAERMIQQGRDHQRLVAEVRREERERAARIVGDFIDHESADIFLIKEMKRRILADDTPAGR